MLVRNSPYFPLTGTCRYPDMLEVGNMATLIEDRTHFGAWCIVSSPLILGYDLLNEDTTSKVWDIITNREVIAVNQKYAGHPGKWVKDYITTPPSAVVPRLGKHVYAVKCDPTDATSKGWVYDFVTKAFFAPGDNMCLDATGAGGTKPATLASCSSGSAAQKFFFNGSAAIPAPIFSVSSPSLCIDVWEGNGPPGGPVVQWYNCHGAGNEVFSLHVEEGGRLVDKNGQCLVARGSSPPGNQGIVQLWAKPQPEGALAVFLLSNQDTSAPNTTITIDVAQELNMTGAVSVRDLWSRTNLGSHTGFFTTDAFGGHDSRFYLFSPGTAEQRHRTVQL